MDPGRDPLSPSGLVEARLFKWPRRGLSSATVHVLGEDQYGRWTGVHQGAPWRSNAGVRAGVFETAIVRVYPPDAYWAACFRPSDPMVDVDILLPVTWTEDAVEEIDLELDVIRLADGSVYVRDQEEFERVRSEMGLPEEIARRAEETCAAVLRMVERNEEPFATVGQAWLERFMAEAPASRDLRP